MAATGAVMKRTTIMLPTKLKADAERVARRNGESLGEFIRQSLQRYLDEGIPKSDRDPFFADHFTFEDSGPPDLAANANYYLSEMLVADYERTQRDARKERASRRRRKTSKMSQVGANR
jgi:hypothetical protein